MTLQRLFSPCVFGHSSEWVYAPGLQEKLCSRCLQPVGAVLAGEMITEPLPQVVTGQPTGKAQPVIQKRAIVTPLRRERS